MGINMRKSGILMPVTSLPSPYGIGCFSREAYEFVDRLKQAGQSYWQILPLGPTGYGDSPYQSFSTFAGNPYLIDLEDLVRRGLLTRQDCEAFDFGRDEESVDYEKLSKSRPLVLRRAFENSRLKEDGNFHRFVEENRDWLEDYALFMAVKDRFSGGSWTRWEEDIRLRHPQALVRYREQCREEIAFYQFQQYLFSLQWAELKAYAHQQKVRIIGDIPIYVALDSADAWAHPELFQFDENRMPVKVAGCPPDAYSARGQLWGNPLYRWGYHKQSGYAWWIKRMKAACERYDVVRIDHFRGFDEYYAIPIGNSYGEADAGKGAWEKGPGYDFFWTLKEVLGEKEIIAEDLGFLTKSVTELVEHTGYPGMKVLQFAFDGGDTSVSKPYLPHNYSRNTVVYTGTHDNNTILGWYENLTEQERERCDAYLSLQPFKTTEIVWEIIKRALAAVSNLAVIPMQDYLGLGAEARINTPSTLGGNWKWRMKPGAFTEELAEQIRALTGLYDR